MGGNLVKLIFSCISTGSGWSDLRKNAADSLKNMGQLSGMLKSVALHAGTMGGAIGRALSAFAMGNVWGIAAVGITTLIDKLGIFKDKTDDTKEKLDKLEEASRKFYETINSNSQKSLEKIDKETKRRNEQLDITNRMIKAELQLQKTRALATGDTKGVERIDRQMVEQDQQNEMAKAVLSENAAGANYRTAEGGLDAARKAAKQAQDEIAAIQSRIFYQHWDQVRGNAEANFKGAFGQNARFDDSALWNDFRKNFRYSDDETKQITAAKERLALDEKNLEAQRKATDDARESYKIARDNVKALKAEQEAANAEANRTASKSQAERTIAYNKQIRDLEAKINAEIRSRDSLNEDELEQLRAKYEQRREEAELAVKDAEEKKLMSDNYGTEQDKAVADKELKLARERVKTIAAEEKKAEKDLAQKKKEERIKALQEEIRKANEARKKSLKDDIEANRKRADDLGRRLEDATARANAAHDVLGNAANMDQAGGISENRREFMNNSRYANGAIDLIGSGKIRRGANGEWVANGRLSNMNQAILERLNADQNKQKLEKENDKVVKKLDELIKKLEQMSTI